MDNSQFRSLIQNGRDGNESPSARDFKKPALGSRSRNLIPMTPRSVAGHSASKEFARQLAEHRNENDGQPPTKKFKSSAAPKGTRFASGYQDRTLARRGDGASEEVSDDKEKRLKALEEMYKLQQIDETTFNKLKDEIGVGGNLNSTHLVKGLDWKLLERVRRGEDINTDPTKAQEASPEATKVDVDDELDQVLDKEVQANGPTSKKQQLEDPDVESVEARHMTRDEILAQLKQRRAGKEAVPPPAPVLNDRFKKVVSEKKSNKKKFVEVVNGRRREVLVITNKDGSTKRKSRWIDPEDVVSEQRERQPLGMEVPAEFLAKQRAMLDEQAAEDEDDDIFHGVGDYDPLAGINSDSDDVDGKDDKSSKQADAVQHKTAASVGDKPRNYFGTSNKDQADEEQAQANPIMKDPTLLAALKCAAGLRRNEEQQDDGDDTNDPDPDRAAKQQKLLARLKDRDRADAEDLDLGFGESRFGDEDDDEGVVYEDGEGAAKKTGRKRGSKKRKGDKDNVGDVMSVLAGRKEEK